MRNRRMAQNNLDIKQQIQVAQYEYPYHYIPTWNENGFSQVHYWSWGFRYLGGMQIVLDQLEKYSFGSLIDVGCGDGRFLGEVSKRYPNASLMGIDFSTRAIQLAGAMNPGLNYKALNIIEEPISDRFDAVTLIEVLEHIPPNEINSFLEAVANLLNQNGWFILTVPHTNLGLQDKHYQHFTSRSLLELLRPFFQDIEFVPFDVKSKVMRLFQMLIGGKGNQFIITSTPLLSWFFQVYKNCYLYSKSEKKCRRIAAVCKKR